MSAGIPSRIPIRNQLKKEATFKSAIVISDPTANGELPFLSKTLHSLVIKLLTLNINIPFRV